MSDEPEASDYYFAKSYYQFWTEEEVEANTCFTSQSKREKVGNCPEAEDYARYMAARLCNPEVSRLFSKGARKFYKDLVERLRRECADRLPKCPKCNGILRTEKAQQCFDCGYDWHTPNIGQPQSPPSADQPAADGLA